jgi:hypothetical protein
VLDHATLDGLHQLRLPGMARGLLEQREHPDYANLGFEERLGMLVDRELTERQNRRLQRMLKTAHLRIAASVEDVDFTRPRGLERSQVLSLAESHWVGSHHSVVVVGATGLGKTYLACALANAAIRHGHSALYLRGPRLHDEIALARAEGRLTRLLSASARLDVLVSTPSCCARSPPTRRPTYWRSSRTVSGCARPSSPASCPSPFGTTPSASPPSPTASWTGCSSTSTASSCAASRSAERPRPHPILPTSLAADRDGRLTPSRKGGDRQGLNPAQRRPLRGLRLGCTKTPDCVYEIAGIRT